MGPNVKLVLVVLEWSYVVPEKTFFKNRVWFGVTAPPGLANHHTFPHLFFFETFPYSDLKNCAGRADRADRDRDQTFKNLNYE